MITLNQATADAFGSHQVRLTPLLTLIMEDGSEQRIAPEVLITRPARTCSPVVSRTPVVRLDLEIAPTEAMLAVFVEKRRIRYQEIVNGQLFDMFEGRVEAIDGGWSAYDGAIRRSLKITCYSYSQALKDADVELWHRTANMAAEAGEGLAMRCVYTNKRMFTYRRSSGVDYLPVNAVRAPNVSSEIMWKDGSSTYYRFPQTDYFVEIDPVTQQLCIRWTGATPMPPAGTAYSISLDAVVGFVAVEGDDRFTLAATPATINDYNLVETNELAIEAIDPLNLDFIRYFCETKSNPVAYTRMGAGTGAPALGRMSDWEWVLERGFARYVGKGLIVDGFNYTGDETFFVGFTGLQWPDPAAAGNEAAHVIARLFEQAGVIADADSYTGFQESRIALRSLNLKGKGAEVLTTLYDSVPPNYRFWDGADGLPRARMLTQNLAADFEVTAIKALTNAEPPAMYTRTVMRTIASDVGKFGNGSHKALYESRVQANDDIMGAFVDDDDVYATVPAAYQYLQLAYFLDHATRFKSAVLRFKGDLKVLATAGLPLDMTDADFLVPYTYVAHDAVNEIAIQDIPDVFSHETLEGKWIVFQLHRSAAVPDPELYWIEIVEGMVLDAHAMLYDGDGDIDAWVDTTSEDGAGRTLRWAYKVVPTDFLQRWLINPDRSTDPDTFFKEWWKHRNRIIEIGAVSVWEARDLAKNHQDDTLRRATAQELEVMVDPRAEIGDTVAVYDAATGLTHLRLIVGYRDGNSFAEPTTVLELADFTF